MIQLYHRDTDPEAGPIGPPASRALISSLRIDEGPGHDRVSVWNRGGGSGNLVVNLGDGQKVAALLLPTIERRGVPEGAPGCDAIDYLRNDMNVVLDAWHAGAYKPGPSEVLISEAKIQQIVALGRVYHTCKALLNECAPEAVGA